MPDLQNKTAVVTGATSGIGRGIAEHFAELGARVLLSGRSKQRGAEAVEKIRAAGGSAEFYAADLADESQCGALIRYAAERLEGIDILVNNAADTSRGTLEATPVALWDRIMKVNLRAPFLLIQEAIGPMKARGGGSIVNIGSVNAYIGEPKLAAYSVSKGGLMTLTKNAASSLAKHRIRVNQINVGWTLTEGERSAKRDQEGQGEDWLERAEKTRPFGRLLAPIDVARAAAYFASEASRLVTGTVMDLEQFPVGAPPDW